MAEIFGFTIKKAGGDKAKSFVAPSADDGSLDIGTAAGFFGQYYGAEAAPKNDFDLIKNYRMSSEHPEADQAIEDIVNEAIIADVDEPSVSLSLDFVNFSPDAPPCWIGNPLVMLRYMNRQQCIFFL